MTVSLYICSENLSSTFLRIGMWRWIFPTLPLTRSAEAFLFPIGSTTVVYQRIASAVGTMSRESRYPKFLREARMQREERMVKESKRPSGS